MGSNRTKGTRKIAMQITAVVAVVFGCILLSGVNASAATTTINFNSLFCCPFSYTESGLTVKSNWPAFPGPPGFGHLHADFNGNNGTQALSNHDGGCCTDPFVFDMGGAPFGVVSAKMFNPFSSSGTSTFKASNGATFTVTITGYMTVTFPSSFQGITYFVWDVGFVDYTSMDDLVIGSVDTTPPTITSVSANPGSLWPPNHKMVPISISISATDDTDPSPSCSVSSVSSNEPIDGLGDGDTSPDWVITGPTSVNLRSERGGGGSGRVYTITVKCTDSAGNSSTATTTVTVPHDRR